MDSSFNCFPFDSSYRFAKAKHMLGSHEDALQLLKKARQAGAEKPPCDRLEEEVLFQIFLLRELEDECKSSNQANNINGFLSSQINAVQAHCKEVEKEMCKLMLKQK